MAENVVEILVKSRDKTKAGFTEAVVASEVAASRVKEIWDRHLDAVGAKMALVGTGLGKGGGILALGSAALAAASPLGALTVAVGAFGAVAVPELTKVHDAMTKTGTAGQKAWKQLTPDERALGGAIKGVETSFKQVAHALAPVVDQVVALGARTLKDAMPALEKLAKAGGQVLTAFLKPFDAFIRSKVFEQIINQFAQFAVQTGKLVGPVMVQLIKILLQLFVQLMPSGVQILKVLLPLIVQLASDLSPVIVTVAKATAAFLNWLTQTRLLKPVLLGLVPVLILLSSSSGIGLIITAVALLVAGIVELSKHWRQIWTDIKNWARDAWNFLTHGWGQFLIPGLLLIRKEVEFIRDHWRAAWDAIRSATSAAISFVTGSFNRFRSNLSSAWNAIKSTAISAWNSLWANTVTRVSRGVSDVVTWVRGLPGKITAAVGKAASVLTSWGSGVIHGLLSGMSSVITDVWNFIKGIPGKILHFLGIKSPPQWAIDAGKHIMNGLGIGMTQAKDVMGKAVTASTQQFSAGNLAAGVGGGVQRWAGTVQKALSMLGLPKSLLGMVLTQMQSESGGNPTIVNKWDSNWKAGHPSVGLMQVIRGTYQAYAGPFRNTGPFEYGVSVNPLANIYAALNYALHNRGFGSGPGQVGSGHGYAAGGPASGWAWVGEHGRELVRLPTGSHVYSNADSTSAMGGGMGGVLQLEIAGGGQSQVEQFLLWMIRNLVRVKGGGDVQKAFGRT